jgi:hypothetical protein
MGGPGVMKWALAAMVLALVMVREWRRRRRGPRQDSLALDELAEAGSDLDAEHRMEFFFFAKDEAGMTDLAAGLRRLSMVVHVNRVEASKAAYWSVKGVTVMAPKPDAVARMRSTLEALARKTRTTFDGWGAEAKP